MDKRWILNHGLKLLAIIVQVFVIGYFLEFFKNFSSKTETYFGITAEILPLVLAFSIFVITWFAYEKSRDNHSLFLGMTFFIIGLLSLYTMLSYPFMPDFITPNSYQKTTIFWGEKLMISSLLFLASAYIYDNTLPRMINKSVMFSLVVIFSFFSIITIPFFSLVPILYSRADGPSENLIFLVVISVVIISYTCYIYLKRFRKTHENHILCLIYSFCMLFSSYIVYIFYNYTAHLLEAAGFYFIYFALFKKSIIQPYEKMTEAEKKLRFTAEERYRSLVDNANDAIITTDLDGRVTSWNRSAEKTFWWSSKEVIGKKLSHLIVPPEKMAENELFIHNILQGKEVFGVETVHQRKDGSKIDVSLTFSPLYNSNHRILGLSCIIRDVTERKHVEEIQNENMRLEIGIRAEAELLPAISHDLATPLNAILGFSTLLKQKIPGDLNNKQEYYVDDIIASGRRMLDIIDDILDLGKAQTGKIDLTIEKISVQIIIDETANLVKERVTKLNVELKKDIDPELEFIMGDRQRFKQILFNLLSNAVKCSKPDGGTVIMKAKKEGNMAIFSVSDNGIGIKEEDKGKLFKAFEQINLGIASKYGSTGLGLVVTKKLVELQNGKIWVESKYGEGSTFTFTLPLAAKIKN